MMLKPGFHLDEITYIFFIYGRDVGTGGPEGPEGPEGP